MRALDEEDIYVVGECAQHREQGLLPHAGLRPRDGPPGGAELAALRPWRAGLLRVRRRAARRRADLQLQRGIEERFAGLESPAKLKLGVAGCPRNCSEDVGLVAVEGARWEMYVGVAAGAHVRKGELLCTLDSAEEAMLRVGRFIQYYRETARWLERTYGFMERVGVDAVRAVVVEDAGGVSRPLPPGVPTAPGRSRCGVRGRSPLSYDGDLPRALEVVARCQRAAVRTGCRRPLSARRGRGPGCGRAAWRSR